MENLRMKEDDEVLGVVAGAQPKLTARYDGGRYIVGTSVALEPVPSIDIAALPEDLRVRLLATVPSKKVLSKIDVILAKLHRRLEK